MSFCVARGIPLSYMTAWKGGVTPGPEYIDTYNWVHLLSSWNSEYCQSAILQYKIKLFNQVWTVGMPEEDLHSL